MGSMSRLGHIKGHKDKGRWVIDEPDPVAAYKAHLVESLSRRRSPVHAGDKFGYWTVIADPEYNHQHNRSVLCRCICGKIKKVNLVSLTSGRSTSCGCHRSDSQTPEQKAGKAQGHEFLQEIHRQHLAGKYLDKTANKNSSTGHIGVSRPKTAGKFRAYIMLDRKQIHLGSFDRLEDAIAARKAAEEKYFADRQAKVDTILQTVKKSTHNV